MGKIIKYIGLFLGSMLLISSCVYPFEPEDLDVEATAIVMEGDINIGDFSKFYSSTSVSISSDDMQVKNIPLDEIRVEGKNGAVCDAFTVEIEEDARYAKGEKRVYVLDTRTLPAEGDYRLVFRVGDKTYSSNWSQCLRTPEIDSITYSVKEDLSSLDILPTLQGRLIHSNTTSGTLERIGSSTQDGMPLHITILYKNSCLNILKTDRLFQIITVGIQLYLQISIFIVQSP